MERKFLKEGEMSKMSAQEFDGLIKKFKEQLRRSPFHNAGLGDFKKLLADVGSTYPEFEKHQRLLTLTHTEYKKLRDDVKRKDIVGLYKSFGGAEESGAKGVAPQAQAVLVDLLMKILSKHDYGIEAKDYSLHENASNSSEKELAFNYYYWYENTDKTVRKVKTGNVLMKLAIRPDKNFEVTEAKMWLHRDPKGDIGVIHYHSEKILNPPDVHDMLVFHFKDENHEHIKSYMMLHIGKILPDQWAMLNGTFVTVSRSNDDTPIAGEILIEKLPSVPDQLPQFVNPEDIAPEIHHYLYRTRITSQRRLYGHAGHLPSAQEISRLDTYVGQYEGLYYRKSKRKNNSEDRVERFYFEIRANGEAVMQVPLIGEAYKGRVRFLTHPEALIAQMDYIPGQNSYRFSIYFNKEFILGEYKTLYAVYAGLEKIQTDIPTAGRMVLRQIKKPANIMDHLQTMTVPEFISNTGFEKEKDILSGRAGDINDYIETLPLPSVNRLPTQLLAIAGTYYCYCLSAMRNHVYREVIKIGKDGDLLMKTRDCQNGLWHHGYAMYNGSNRLSLNIEKANERNAFFHLLFNISNFTPTIGRSFYGVSSKFDSNGTPSGKMEVMVRINESFEEATCAQYVVESNEFKDADHQTMGILSLVTCRGDQMTSAGIPNHSQRQERAKTYFGAACYTAQQADSTSERIKSLEHLYQAYLYGFGRESNERSLILKEISEGGALSKLLNYGAMVRPQGTELPELTFDNLVEKFRLLNIDPYLSSASLDVKT